MLRVFHSFNTLCEFRMKQSCLAEVIWFGLLCSLWMPIAQGLEEYVMNKEYDAILVDCAIAFVVLSVIFLILLLITTLAVYRRLDGDSAMRKRYQVSYRGDSNSSNVRDISSPFYGHSIYSRRTTNSIYLPGRESSTVVGADGKPVKNVAYENEAAIMYTDVKRSSPPTEKGQKDSMVSEKKKTVRATFENPAYDGVEKESHTYESVDNTTRYTTTTMTYTREVKIRDEAP
ncbi:hypothetical protein OS493_022458 [Desmophyllum pertusum]|uniref:Uncharacterized protein n=1 Tax=Desmophyllum pertusum TaxID=174260 RepID=A0A9X0D2C7_9CNID|nr:hypothetical protein OS493_022458 [Desmophyllum pertusum]